MIDIIQSIPRGITCTSILSMVGEYWMKDRTYLVTFVYSANANLAKRSTYLFSSLRICTNLTGNSLFILLLTMLKNSFIYSPFAS